MSDSQLLTEADHSYTSFIKHSSEHQALEMNFIHCSLKKKKKVSGDSGLHDFLCSSRIHQPQGTEGQ